MRSTNLIKYPFHPYVFLGFSVATVVLVLVGSIYVMFCITITLQRPRDIVEVSHF